VKVILYIYVFIEGYSRNATKFDIYVLIIEPIKTCDSFKRHCIFLILKSAIKKQIYACVCVCVQLKGISYRYIMFRRGICEKYQSRDEKFPEPNDEGNLVSRLLFFASTLPKHDISV
jgi:hypothetical protein